MNILHSFRTATGVKMEAIYSSETTVSLNCTRLQMNALFAPTDYASLRRFKNGFAYTTTETSERVAMETDK
jgi:hypothetical protein